MNTFRAVKIVMVSLLLPVAVSLIFGAEPAQRARRVLYNFDGDSCLSTKAQGKGPVRVDVDDVKRLIAEVAYAEGKMGRESSSFTP